LSAPQRWSPSNPFEPLRPGRGPGHRRNGAAKC
jgi:hypothetical protein